MRIAFSFTSFLKPRIAQSCFHQFQISFFNPGWPSLCRCHDTQRWRGFRRSRGNLPFACGLLPSPERTCLENEMSLCVKVVPVKKINWIWSHPHLAVYHLSYSQLRSQRQPSVEVTCTHCFPVSRDSEWAFYPMGLPKSGTGQGT